MRVWRPTGNRPRARTGREPEGGGNCHKAEKGARRGRKSYVSDRQRRPPAGARRVFLARAGGRRPRSMNERPKAVQKAKRDERLGRALRENLKRRKAQARDRSAADSGAARPDTPRFRRICRR